VRGAGAGGEGAAGRRRQQGGWGAPGRRVLRAHCRPRFGLRPPTLTSRHPRPLSPPPPRFIGGWTGAYILNAAIVIVMSVGGFGMGGYSSVVALVDSVATFGLFAKCYSC
jgi:hypothetical protein